MFSLWIGRAEVLAADWERILNGIYYNGIVSGGEAFVGCPAFETDKDQ